MTKGRWLLAALVFTCAVLATNNYLEKQPKVATYNVLEEATFFNWLRYKISGSDEDTRHSAVIQITNTTPNAQYGSCTAFVVTDTSALTAGHCMKWTKYWIESNRKQVLARSKEIEQDLIGLLVELETNCPAIDIRCQQIYKQTELELEKELAARESLISQKPDEFKVTNAFGEDTGIKAVAYSKFNPRRDYGWIEGDFKNFKKLPIRAGWHVKPNDILRVCGFYGSKLPPVCTDFKAIGNHGFAYKGEGVMVPGVSGGPVIDHEGYVVGVAAAAGLDFVVMHPTIGIIDILTPSQARKRNGNRNSRGNQ